MLKINLISFSAIMLSATLFCSSCKKESCEDGEINQDETAVDCGGICDPCPSCSDGLLNQNEVAVDCGGSCPDCPSCFDGIQNQGELGEDCGGPCIACNYTCTGLPGNESLMPLELNNSWYYEGVDLDRALSITGNEEWNGQTYFMMEHWKPGNTQPEIFRYRYNNLGDLVRLVSGSEFVMMPANPTEGLTWYWALPGGAQVMEILSIDDTLQTPECSYSNVVVLLQKSSTGGLQMRYHFVKGVGIVRETRLINPRYSTNLYMATLNN